MRYIVNILFLLGFALNLSGQNLVLNGGFEDLISCPQTQGGSPANYYYNWYSPNKNTPDYFNTCTGSNTFLVGAPENLVGFQYPYNGNGYAGFATSIFSGGGEFLTGKLSDNLKPYKKYCFNLQLGLADRQAIAHDRIGIYFSSDSIHYETYFVLPVTPQIETEEWVFYTDTVNWMPVNLEYTAQGGERYFTIGNFRDEIETHFINLDSNQTFSYAYYYIDDVSLVECKGSAVEENPTAKAVNIYPNPASTTFNIQYSFNSNAVFELYSIDGKKLDAIQLQDQSGIYFYATDALSNGIYFYRLLVNGSTADVGKLAIIK